MIYASDLNLVIGDSSGQKVDALVAMNIYL